MSDLVDEPNIDVQYTVWQEDGSNFCDPEDAPVIDRAMKLWAESRRDSWISVHGPTGAEISMLASKIVSTSLTTLVSRRTGYERDKALEDERKALRAAAGFIGDEE